MEPESTDQKSNLLFSAIMLRYEVLSHEIASMSSEISAPWQRHDRKSNLTDYLKNLKLDMVDFINFARFHPKFFKQIEKDYKIFLMLGESKLSEKSEKQYARNILRMWNSIQKAMIDQKIVELKGV